MALGPLSFGAAAYSANGGTSVSPTYPTNAAGDCLILIIGQKPSTANGGTVTTPSGWTLVTSIKGAGGYGATLGADTGNTNLFVYTRTSPSGGLSGTLAVTVGTNNVCWGILGKVTPDSGTGCDVVGWTTSDTTAGSVSATFATSADVTANDRLVWAMCIPTDVTTPAQFSAHAVSSTGVTFGTVTEAAEPDSGTGNDIGGYVAYAGVTAGTTSGNTTVTATAGGTTTNVRGPLAMVRLREIIPLNDYTITVDEGAYSYTGTDAGLNYYAYTATDTSIYFAALDTTFTPITGVMRVRTNATPQLDFTGAYYFYPSGTNNGGYPVEAIWRYRTVGGAWTDVGSAIANTQQAIVVLNVLDTNGDIDVSTSLTGLSANTNYEVQLLWRRTLSTPATPEMIAIYYTSPDTPATVSAVFATGYTLTADAGTYSYTGTAANTLFNRKVVADPGTYSYTGTAANTLYNRRMPADAGTYSYTGTAANTLFNRKVVADAGTYSYTGTDASFLVARVLTADAGTYSYTGTAANTLYNRRMPADSGTYSYTGTAANTLYNRRMPADSGTYSYTGTAASLLFNRKLVADSGSYSYTGTDATLTYATLGAYVLTADAGTYSYTGSAANLSFGRRIAADSGAYSYTGTAASLLFNRKIVAAPGAYAYVGATAGMFYGRKIVAESGAYTYAGSDAVLIYTTSGFRIYLGASQVNRIYLGTDDISKVFLGTTEI